MVPRFIRRFYKICKDWRYIGLAIVVIIIGSLVIAVKWIWERGENIPAFWQQLKNNQNEKK